MMDIISKSPNASKFTLSCHFRNQNDAVVFCQLLLKIVHYNSRPKTIHLYIDGTSFIPIDWKFIKVSETSGIGSIESLKIMFEDYPTQKFYVDVVAHLARNIEINQLVADDTDFAGQVQAKCFKLVNLFGYEETDIDDEEIEFDWTELKDFEKVVVEGDIPALTKIVENVDHPNVHFVLLDKFIMTSDMSRVPVNLIHTLPASKVKTITYPGAETDSMTSGEFLPVPETTFVCNNLLIR